MTTTGIFRNHNRPKNAAASRMAFRLRAADGDWIPLADVEAGEMVVAWMDTVSGRARPVHEALAEQRRRAAEGLEPMRPETLTVQAVPFRGRT